MESRIKVYPQVKIKTEKLKSTLTDGTKFEAILEFVEREVNLESLNYTVFIGSTAGRKGLPNQDFAGLAKNKVSIEERPWECLLAMVADGVSSREGSEDTSKSIIENTIKTFSEASKSYKDFDLFTKDMWHSIAEGARRSSASKGVSTVSLFLIAVSNDETRSFAINCGDSRVYWATPKYVESARVHDNVLQPQGEITYCLGSSRDNEKVYNDVYMVKDSISAAFLCTDSFAHVHDGVHFPKDMMSAFGRGITYLNDHLTVVSIRKNI